jgi:hypothetical protein
MIAWHRLFGLALQDFFAKSNYRVEIEKDLSIQQQRLDLIILEQDEGILTTELPDGLEPLAKYNLLTYKSWRQPLTEWALDELIGHYVSYRKLISPSVDQLLPSSDFELYAISTRYPQQLAQQVTLQSLTLPGVYQVTWGSKRVRLLVLNQIATLPKNALWLLFSGHAEQVRFGGQHYQFDWQITSAVLNQLFEYYQLEGITMSYTAEDFIKDYTRDHLHLLTPKEVLSQFSPQELLRQFSPQELLQQVSPAERLRGLSAEAIEAYLQELKRGQTN